MAGRAPLSPQERLRRGGRSDPRPRGRQALAVDGDGRKGLIWKGFRGILRGSLRSCLTAPGPGNAIPTRWRNEFSLPNRVLHRPDAGAGGADFTRAMGGATDIEVRHEPHLSGHRQERAER